MSATAQDVTDLERIAYRIREDTYGCTPWDRHGTHIVFHEFLTGMHLATAIEIVVRNAADVDAKTPGSIKRKFLPTATAPPTRDQLPPRERPHCSTHIDNPPPPHCPTCATEPFKAYHDGLELDGDRPAPGTPEYRALALTPKETK